MRFILISTAIFLFNFPLLAQEEEGAAAASSTQVANSEWKNWAFAGGAASAAAVGIVAAMFNNGSHAH